MKSPVFLVTGAGKGIGRGIVEDLIARAGSSSGEIRPKLFLFSRTVEDLKALQAQAEAKSIEVEVFAGDLSRLEDVDQAVRRCLARFSTVDCLIHSAGVGRFGDFADLTVEDLDFVMNTNVRGTFVLTQKVFAEMRKKKSGQMVFITSVAAEKPFEQSAIYCASKYAQKGLIDVLRLYGYQSNVRILNVMPGAVLTPMWGDVSAEMRARMMNVADVARAVVDACLVPPPASVEELVIRPISGDL